MTPYERISAVFDGRVPDRPPIYDLIANDSVIQHFAGRCASGDASSDTVYGAYAAGAVDATRQRIFVPQHETEELLPTGQMSYNRRWTSWVEPIPFPSLGDAVTHLQNRLETPSLSEEVVEQRASHWVSEYRYLSECISPCALIGNYARKVGLMELYQTYGWEIYSYMQADSPDLVEEFLERTTCESIRAIDALDIPEKMPATIACMDIAGTNGPLVSPAFLRRSFLPRLERIVHAFHRKGVPFVFHSDGNLMPVLDDLVACGIDGLNPIDVAAGMDIGTIRGRYPDLVLVGGVDAIHALPHGTPEDVRQVTAELIETAGPALLVGSTSEISDDVPLENYLAMLDVARCWHY